MSGGTEPVDVLIIGSGLAGATYARTICDAVPDARILMVEVGPAIPGKRGEHTHNMTQEERKATELLTQGPDAGTERRAAMADIAPGIDPSLEFRYTILPGLFFVDPRPQLCPGEVGLPAASMTSGVGGMGVHWGISCPRPHQGERIPFIPAHELDGALGQAERILGVTRIEGPGTGVVGAIRQAMAEEFDGPGLTPTGFMPVAAHWEGDQLRFSGTGVLLDGLKDSTAGFELRSETLARQVLLEDDVAVGAELEDRRAGRLYTVRARQVVVCADALRTPQLLFASGIRPRALGHYLNEHFQMLTFVNLSDDFAPARFCTDGRTIASVLVPFSDARPMEGTVTALAAAIHRSRWVESGEGSRLGVLNWYGAKDIQFGDTVELSETEKDFYGMPRISIRYRRTGTDLRTIEQMRENSIRGAARLGALVDPPTLAAGGSSLHYQGTVRMGAVDDGTSVCDSYLRVWGVRNLRVAGNGVIPTRTAANPTLTTVALAYRAASQIARELGGQATAAGGPRPQLPG